MKQSGIMIGSEDPKKLSDFYTKVLGQPAWEMDGWTGYTNGGNLMIGAHSEVKGRNATPGRIMLNFEAADVQGEFARIEALGTEVISKPYQPSADDKEIWMATFADPDGNYFQIASPWKE